MAGGLETIQRGVNAIGEEDLIRAVGDRGIRRRDQLEDPTAMLATVGSFAGHATYIS